MANTSLIDTDLWLRIMDMASYCQTGSAHILDLKLTPGKQTRLACESQIGHLSKLAGDNLKKATVLDHHGNPISGVDFVYQLEWELVCEKTFETPSHAAAEDRPAAMFRTDTGWGWVEVVLGLVVCSQQDAMDISEYLTEKGPIRLAVR